MANSGLEQTKFSAFRAICVGVVLLVIGAFWVVLQEILLDAGDLSSNAPPVGAVGLFLAVLSVAVVLGRVRRRWNLDRRELLLIYCMLVTFFPLASQGLWHRFVGTMISVRSFTHYQMPMPGHMVPQGNENFLANGECVAPLEGWEGDAVPTEVMEHGRPVSAALLVNATDDAVSELKQRMARRGVDAEDRFGPGEVLTVEARVLPRDLADGAQLQCAISVDGHRWEDVRLGMPTWLPLDKQPRASADGSGLKTVVAPMVKVPFGIDEGLWLRLRLIGAGQLAIARIACFSNEGVARLLEGSEQIDAAHYAQVPRDGRSRLTARPAGFWAWLGGMLKGHVPWRLWGRPLLAWGLLWVAMFLGMIALAALLFRQWSEHEKLAFPLTVLPLALTEQDADRPGGWPTVMRRRALWVGVAIALAVYLLNGLHFYDNDVPGLPLAVDLSPLLSEAPWRALLADGNGLALRVILLGVGVAYFMDLNMSFNLWFFFLLCKVGMLAFYYHGSLDQPAWEQWPTMGPALWHLQGFGSAMAIVLIVIWLARRHLVAVWHALWRPATMDDALDPMPYRWAALLLVLSFVLLAIWGRVSGAGAWFGVWGMGMMLAFAVMAARVRAECAAPGMWIVPAAPAITLMALGGIAQFGVLPMSYVIFAGSFMCVGYFLMMMPALIETFHIAKVALIPRRDVLCAMVIGFVVAVSASGYMLLNWGYARGLTSMRGSLQSELGWAGIAGTYSGEGVLWGWRLKHERTRITMARREELDDLVAAGKALSPEQQQEHARLAGSGIHAASGIAVFASIITCLLAGLRWTFLKFPLHPIGYALATTQVMSVFWFSIFLAWLARLVALRLGGVRFLRHHMQPCMIGLVIGSVLALLIWDVVAVVKIANGFTGKVYVTW